MSIETFASPSLRWGLLLEDHPGATWDCELVPGKTLGFPEQFGGSANFCVCTITFPVTADGTQLPSVSAHKDVDPKAKGLPDEWIVLQTKTLGRALKKAGYPDDMGDLKALVVWRQRNAEIQAVESGVEALPSSAPSPLAIGSGERIEEVLDQAAVPADFVETEPDLPADHEDDLITSDDGITDAEIVEDGDNGSDQDEDLYSQIMAEIETLTKEERANLREWLEFEKIPPKAAQWSDADLTNIAGWLRSEPAE